jgi:hypothetical protein
MKLLYLKRSGAHWPGAVVERSDDDAEQLVGSGVCVPYTAEQHAIVREILANAKTVVEEIKLPSKGENQ